MARTENEDYIPAAGEELVKPFSNEAISRANNELIAEKVIRKQRMASEGRVYSLNGRYVVSDIALYCSLIIVQLGPSGAKPISRSHVVPSRETAVSFERRCGEKRLYPMEPLGQGWRNSVAFEHGLEWRDRI